MNISGYKSSSVPEVTNPVLTAAMMPTKALIGISVASANLVASSCFAPGRGFIDLSRGGQAGRWKKK